MKEKNGKIVEITESELFELWLKREMCDIYSFDTYKWMFENAGCTVIDEDAIREEKKKNDEKRQRLISQLTQIIGDLAAGYDGFMYLYPIVFPEEGNKNDNSL